MVKPVLIETSARHVHVSAEALEVLFGKGYTLTVKKELSQPCQYACEERVTIVGPKRELKNVSILGPTRPESQVEISLTDARSIGVAAPIRESGDTAGSPGCTLIGPAGQIELDHGVIVAKRHIHMTPDDAAKYGLENKQIVSVKVEGTGREALLGDVVVRVSEKFALAMHIDTDECNGVGAKPGIMGEIIA